MATIAAHQPPADRPIVAQAARSVWMRKVRATQFGTSLASQVSSWGLPLTPLTHSVSTPAGICVCGETTKAGRIRFAAACCATLPPRFIVSIHCLELPGMPWKASMTGYRTVALR